MSPGWANFSTPETEVVDAHLALAAAGLSDLVWGHAAVRLVDGSGIAMKAAGLAFEEVGPTGVVGVDWDGSRTAGEGPVHIEVPIHVQIMRARPDVTATVHTHAPAVTAFASMAVPMRAISHDGVPFVPDLPRFERTGNLIDTTVLGKALTVDLGNAAAILIPQHGSVTVGRTTAEAVMHAVLLERACTAYLAASAAGGPVVWSNDEEVAAKRPVVWSQQQMEAGYSYLVRKGKRMRTSG